MKEVLICVDVETSGPVPGEYSLLSIGACVVGESNDKFFYAELQPLNNRVEAAAMKIHRLDFNQLKQHGLPPAEAMIRFEECALKWSDGGRPVFVGYNAPFDWMFIAYYFHRFLERNPFGHTAFDLKPYLMSLLGSNWENASTKGLKSLGISVHDLPHNALEDAREQSRWIAHALDIRRCRSW